MASIPLSGLALASLKKALRKDCSHVRSSHLSEALSAALGFRTHAALLNKISKTETDPVILLLDDERFDTRLQELGYPPDTEFSFELLEAECLISTQPLSSFNIDYRTIRTKAWRNLMVYTINEGIRQKLFSLRTHDNRWPGAKPEESSHRDEGYVFTFLLPDGKPAKGYVGDAGFGELSIHVAVNPKGDWIRAWNAGFLAGDAVASGWLERKNGAWLQSSPEMFNCRRPLTPVLAEIRVNPLGFGDRGQVIM